MNIRKAVREDAETVNYITSETIKTVYPHYYPSGAVRFFLEHHRMKKIASDIQGGCVYLCERGGRPVGTVTINENEINRLFVLPGEQGKGFGRELMDFAEKEISKSFGEITLSASLSAKSIYLSRGYRSTEFHIIECDDGDRLCYDQMVKTALDNSESA